MKNEMKEPRDIRDRTFAFAVRVVKLCRVLEQTPGVSGILANQLLLSGTSIGSSVEEAHASHHKPDFIAGMALATKEARETNYWLRLLAATEAAEESTLTDITDESHQIIAILTTIVKRSRENKP